MSLPDCWTIMNCGREVGGPKAAELGVCIAATDRYGHSCWALAGTLCGGIVQGTVAQKERNCMACDVYKRYNRMIGTDKDRVVSEHADEERRYQELMSKRLKSLSGS